MTFKLSNGNDIIIKKIPVERNDDAVAEYKKKFGDIRLKHDINSHDPVEQLRANIELAQHNRSHFNSLLPILKYHSSKRNCWASMFPMYTDRAEKILFWNQFATMIIDEGIDRFYFTADTWIYNYEDGIEALNRGDKISSLPNLRESLSAYYLENTGKIIHAASAYSFDATGKIQFERIKIEEEKVENCTMFTAVFKSWNIKTDFNRRQKTAQKRHA